MKAMNILLLTLILLGANQVASAALNPTEQTMIDAIDTHDAEARRLLSQLVNINSGTMNFAGVRAVGDALAPEFEKLGFTTRWVDGAEFNRAGHLVAEHPADSGNPKLLLIGHLDTVFEPDSPFQTMTPMEGDKARGPGIADMKGGNVIMLQALRGLHAAGELADLDVTVVITGDEELSGRPLSLSKKALIDAAQQADIAIGFENGDGNPGTANVSRRGSIGWTLTVTGKPAHSSQIFREDIGAGAIYESARILTSFYTNLRSEELLTFNPGRIVGGTAVTMDKAANSGTTFGKNNVIAETSIVTGDIRAISEKQLLRVKDKMRDIVSRNLPHTSATIEFDEGYPAMAPTDGNKKLLDLYSATSQRLGFGEVLAVNPLRAGAADVSFAAPYVSMAIDALGMGGTEGHTVEEVGDLSTLSSQAKRAAVFIYQLKSI